MTVTNRAKGINRRTLLQSGLAAGAGTAFCAPAAAASPSLPRLAPIGEIPMGDRRWLGAALWGNRLHDWVARGGFAECRTMRERRPLSTAALLTLDLAHPERGGAIETHVERVGTPDGNAFAGFLFGTGGGKLDHRSAALVQAASGDGGGILAVADANGGLSFREHIDEYRPFAFGKLDSRTIRATTGGFPAGARLALVLVPAGSAFDLHLQLRNAAGELIAEEVLGGVGADRLVGGWALAAGHCAPDRGWRFTLPATGGQAFVIRPERGLGPVVSTLHSISSGILKLSAQFFPLGKEEAVSAVLEARRGKGAWKIVAKALVGTGACAQFRVEGWDMRSSNDYRVRCTIAGRDYVYTGTVRPEPAGRPLRIGLFSCVAATLRALDGPPEPRELRQARPCGRFDDLSIVFPHDALVRSAAQQSPDLLVFCGDQFYEQFPTRAASETDASASAEEIELDALYKWLLWCWAFRPLTRDVPSIVLVDDHDYFQPNYWGAGGGAAPERDHNRGGYTRPAEYVRMIERVETGHNPDPYDTRTIDQGISVYYGAFTFGGASFAIIEDRKFKSSILQGSDMDVYEGVLLGQRQEEFLRAWKDMHPGMPKVVLTQTVWACPQTAASGMPLIDYDSNGFPAYPRRVAVDLVRQCKAIMLSGDQHMGSVIRHGIDTFVDGPVQFTGPAGGVGWQRWFEPGALPNSRPDIPHTGDFIDGFGNKMRVLAVAQPRISQAEYRSQKEGRTQRIMDRALKREGFGMAVVDHGAKTVVVECWPWDTADCPEKKQYEGWPLQFGFDEL